ncbi:MAG: LamG domain-containing protein [Chitinophagaceae bacterium]|nr:MAG: LamG domain-containing protein [Chitinophagaceae bacterium]
MLRIPTVAAFFDKADFNTALGAASVLGFEPVLPGNLIYGVTKDNNVCAHFSDLNNTNALPSYRVILPNVWTNIVVQFSHGVQSIYVNGQLVSAMYTPNTTFPMCSSAPIYFGFWWLQDMRAFSGRLDNIRLYTRALQEDEIRYLNVNNL